MTKTAEKTFEEIQRAAEATAPSLRVVEAMAIGDVIRQGDLYVERIAKLPEKRGKKTKNRQLAIGQTQGSRHVIDPAPKGLAIYAPRDGANALEGPLVVTKESWTLTHPEHGHFSLPAGVFAVRYQRDYARERADELRRVQD